MSGTTAPRSPGRPRSAEADAAIVRATLEVLREEGFRGLSVDAVRVRAGVGKATIYRRFPDKEALVRGAIGALDADAEVPDTGRVRDDIQAMWGRAYDAMAAAGAGTFVPRMLAEASGDPDLHRVFREALIEPRRQAVRTVLERGVARGELRADLDVELVIDMLSGPIIYRVLIEAGRLEGAAAQVLRVFDAALDGIGPR